MYYLTMQKLTFRAYAARLWRRSLEEGRRHLTTHIIRAIALIAGAAVIGAPLGNSNLLGSLLVVIFGLLLSLMWSCVISGFLVWKQDQEEMARLRDQLEIAVRAPKPVPSAEALLIARLDELRCVLFEGITASDFMVRCSDRLRRRGVPTEAAELASIVLGQSYVRQKGDPVHEDYGRFLESFFNEKLFQPQARSGAFILTDRGSTILDLLEHRNNDISQSASRRAS